MIRVVPARPGRRRVLSLGTALLLTTTLAVTAVNPSVAGAAPDLASVTLALQPVTSGLASPVALAWRSGDERMYVAEQGGRVRIIDPANGAAVGTALTLTGLAASGERGLLGLTFSLDGTKMYVDYTDSSGTIHVVEYPMAGDTAVVASARELLSIPHPRTNHNGGEVIIGPDGYLYIGTGDGGGGGDPDLNGQNVNVLLGKILRIDPAPSESLPYTIPPDNPFVGLANHREEIWMYGLRNPWRFTFDRDTSDMWIADVGQGLYEEVDYAPAGTSGSNWGWNLREGFHAYAGAQPPDGQDPLFEKAHTDGYCAVIGGYVYRGSAIANLNGAYVFGDLCRSVLSAVVQSGGAVTDQIDFDAGASQITTFGEDHDGELYVANLGGVVYKLVEPPPPRVSVGDKALLEGDSVNRAISFPVTLSQPATSTVTVQYTVAGVDATGGTKQLPGVDFKLKTGIVTFNVNSSGVTPISKPVSVTVYGDTGDESNESFSVTLSSPSSGYSLGRASATGTILDDDAGASGVTLGVGDASIEQQAVGAEKLAIPVTLSAKLPTTTVTVNYTITPGSATYSAKASGGGEFGGKLTGTVKFIPNATLRSISVPIWPDLTADADHQFTIALSGLVGSGVTVIRATGTATILDP